MRYFPAACRQWRSVLALLFAILAMPAGAQDAPAAAAWQEVISGQIQAFRNRDAPTAFNYAGAPFKVSFQSAEVFFEAIAGAGYAPILESHSHSFGAYQMLDGMAVLQQVRLVGGDLQLYEAIYQLVEEPEGWRVQGVQLFRQPGMAT